MQTTKAQIYLRIGMVRSAPLKFSAYMYDIHTIAVSIISSV